MRKLKIIEHISLDGVIQGAVSLDRLLRYTHRYEIAAEEPGMRQNPWLSGTLKAALCRLDCDQVPTGKGTS